MTELEDLRYLDAASGVVQGDDRRVTTRNGRS
jgi:hypothetical protein